MASCMTHRGKEDYWLWDHLMRPTLHARGEIELPSTPGKRSVESAAHFSTSGSSPYQIGAIGATFQRSSPSPIRISAGADDKGATAFLFTQLRGVLDVV
ncbi:unnamed protein product [Arctogadus glacialis]